jgi:rsbT co-antagonist protein RsbR
MKQMFQDILSVDLADNNDNRRGSVIIFLSLFLLFFDLLLFIAGLVLQVPALLMVFPTSVVGCGLIIYLVKRGSINPAAIMMIVFMIITAQTPNFYTASLHLAAAYFISLSIVVAGLTLRPRHVWAVFCVNIAVILAMEILLLNGSFEAIFQNGPITNPLFFNFIVAICSYMSSKTIQEFFLEAEKVGNDVSHHVQLLEQQNVLLEQRIKERTQELQDALQHVESQAAEYQNLLTDNERWRSLIREMNTPAIPVSDETLIVPLVGQIDHHRLEAFHAQALQALVQTRARNLIVDISGVPFIDSQIGQGFVQLVQAARLLGSEVLLVGMRPEVAHTALRLGLRIHIARSFSSLQAALNDLAYQKQLRIKTAAKIYATKTPVKTVSKVESPSVPSSTEAQTAVPPPAATPIPQTSNRPELVPVLEA